MNNVSIIGRITNDLEVRKVGQDFNVLSFSIAVNERVSANEETYFFDITAWNRQAETIATYFRKGQRIGISGRLKQERFQDKEGKNRSKVVIVLGSFDFIEPKDFSGNSQDYQSSPVGTAKPASPQPSDTSPSGQGQYDFPNFPEDQSFEDDEVPF